MPKMVHFGEFLKTWSLRSNSVTRQVSFKKDKNWWKMPKFKNSKCDILSNFQTMWTSDNFDIGFLYKTKKMVTYFHVSVDNNNKKSKRQVHWHPFFFQHDGISFTESLFPKDFVLELITGDSTHFNCQYTLNQNHSLLWWKYLKYLNFSY